MGMDLQSEKRLPEVADRERLPCVAVMGQVDRGAGNAFVRQVEGEKEAIIGDWRDGGALDHFLELGLPERDKCVPVARPPDYEHVDEGR